jgi:hypothetical protein
MPLATVEPQHGDLERLRAIIGGARSEGEIDMSRVDTGYLATDGNCVVSPTACQARMVGVRLPSHLLVRAL